MATEMVRPGPINGIVDMSPAAILQRLEEVGQLYELGLYLAQFKPVSAIAETSRGTEKGTEKAAGVFSAWETAEVEDADGGST